jgi:hypothetical protein
MHLHIQQERQGMAYSLANLTINMHLHTQQERQGSGSRFGFAAPRGHHARDKPGWRRVREFSRGQADGVCSAASGKHDVDTYRGAVIVVFVIVVIVVVVVFFVVIVVIFIVGSVIVVIVIFIVDDGATDYAIPDSTPARQVGGACYFTSCSLHSALCARESHNQSINQYAILHTTVSRKTLHHTSTRASSSFAPPPPSVASV